LLRQWTSNLFTVLADARKKQTASSQNIPAGSFAHTEFLRIERKRLTICLSEIRGDKPFWDSNTAILDMIYAYSRRIGAQYIIVIHPDQFQVEPLIFREVIQHYNLNPQNYDIEQPQKFLLNYCASRQIPCLDLLPVFRQHGANGGLYLPDDTHYNASGNRLAAEQIAPFLIKHSQP
jgi:hypothetical protein